MIAVLQDLNDPSKIKIENIEGFVPTNLVTTDLPEGIAYADADCLDIETYSLESGAMAVRAVLNEERFAIRKAERQAQLDIQKWNSMSLLERILYGYKEPAAQPDAGSGD